MGGMEEGTTTVGRGAVALGVMTSYGGEVDEWIDAENQVIAVMHTWARGKMSGVNVERREAHLWTLRDLAVAVVEAQRRLVVAALEGLKRLTHDLHVLLRHRLLRQPSGSEGFGLTHEDTRPGGPLISPPRDEPLHLVHWRSAV